MPLPGSWRLVVRRPSCQSADVPCGSASTHFIMHRADPRARHVEAIGTKLPLMSDRTDGARRPQEVIRHLERLLDREHQRLEVRRGELSEVREAVRAMAPLLSSPLTVPRADLEIVPAEAAADVIGQLLDDSDGGVIRNVTRTVDYGPGLEEERIRDMQQRLADGLVMRSIYPLSVLDTAAGRRWIAAWADAGEEQRF